MKNALKNVAIISTSVIVVLILNLNLDISTTIGESFTGNSSLIFISWILLWGMSYLYCNYNGYNKRMRICSIILAIIFATFEVLGNSIDNYQTLNGILLNKIAFIKSCLKFIGYVYVFNLAIINLFYVFDNKKKIFEIIKHEEYKEIKIQSGKKLFLISFIAIIITKILFLLQYFPGILTPDSINQVMQVFSIYTLKNHHPIFHTMCIGVCMKAGVLFHSNIIGVAIYSIIQIIVMSLTFAYIVNYMAKKEMNPIIIILSIIYFTFYPVHCLYSITMWKDVPFALVMDFLVIWLNEMITNPEEFFNKKSNILKLIFTIVLTILFRNNGIHVIILTIPFLFIFMKKYWKKLLIITLSVFVIYSIWKVVIFDIIKAENGSIKEALSIPLQFFARVSRDASDTLTNEDKEMIYKFLPVENLGDIYYEKISDNVKKHFNDQAFKENKIEFVKLWVKLSVKHPRIFIESFMCNCYGYWYPEATNWVVARTIHQPDSEIEKQIKITNKPIIQNSLIKKFDGLIDRRDIPLNSMIYSVGFVFWIMCFMIMYIIYKKKYKKILIFLPILFLWLTCLASPVYLEFRYIYSLFTCIPILIGISYTNEEKE